MSIVISQWGPVLKSDVLINTIYPAGNLAKHHWSINGYDPKI
jgi:hypothetical protein